MIRCCFAYPYIRTGLMCLLKSVCFPACSPFFLSAPSSFSTAPASPASIPLSRSKVLGKMHKTDDEINSVKAHLSRFKYGGVYVQQVSTLPRVSISVNYVKRCHNIVHRVRNTTSEYREINNNININVMHKRILFTIKGK